MGDKLDRCWFGRVPVSYYHSGDLGDIIYSLLFARAKGDADYYIGPSEHWRLREQMTQQRFHWIAPLLRRQPWIKSVTWSNKAPVGIDYNLNKFRESWFSKANAHRRDKQLWAIYQEHFGGADLPQNEPWLEADPSLDCAHPVVINRTTRWRNESFPWHDIAAKYRGRMVFVGLPEEYEDWTRRYGKAAEYRAMEDALDMANSIAGAQLFIGNQSLPMAIAFGLGVPVIQETCPNEPDCIFARDNAQYSTKSTLRFPEFRFHRPVSNKPNAQGVVELGPCNGAPGIGDTLMLTPVAKALGDKAVMLLPANMIRMAFLFHGLCQVRQDENHPVFMWPGNTLQSLGHLQAMGLSGVDPIPSINIKPEALEAAQKVLAGIHNPLIFCPTCNHHYVRSRQGPPAFWQSIVLSLSSRYTVLQFGYKEYPTMQGATRAPYLPIETVAAIYKLVGRYIGVNTGDYHLMVAVGGKAVVANPDPWSEAQAWNYPLPNRVAYGKLSNQGTVIEALKRLSL